MALTSTSLDARLQRAIASLPSSHRLPPSESEIFISWEEGKTRLQNYAFTQGFALVTETNDKKNHLVILDCTRHHKRERNTRKLEEKDRVRKNTKGSFNECKYRLRLKQNKDEAWRLIITNPDHNHEMATDPFGFKEHRSQDLDRATALDQAKSLRDASTRYGQASRVLGMTGLRLSNKDYYNLARSQGKYTPEEELTYALGFLEEEGFHVRTLEKYLVENNTPRRRVVEHFFFCNAEQIRLTRRFVSGFLIETDATFNTNQLNLPLSVLVGITNTNQTFPAAYCYITSESAECFTFLFDCMKDLFFHDTCPGPRVILGDFAAGLTAAMHKKRAKEINPDAAMTVAWQVAQSIHETDPDCVLQLCTWHAAEAIKKRLIRAGSYPLEVRKELHECHGVTGHLPVSSLNQP